MVKRFQKTKERAVRRGGRIMSFARKFDISFSLPWVGYVLFVVYTCVAVTSLSGCNSGKKMENVRSPIEVGVVMVSPRDVPVTLVFVGQTESSRQVEIRARVNGFLDKRVYEEGSMVTVGQVMFQMEKSPFEASLQEARGELSLQQARLSQAKVNLDRIRPLVSRNAVSKKDFDDAVSNEQAAQATVLAAEGKVRQAELNVSYTTIRSPVTGLSSRSKKQEGSFISTGPDSLLTYVAQLDPIWVNYSVSENEALKYRDQESKGLLRLPKDNDFVVEVVLADGSIFPHKGRVSFTEPSFSSETGTYMVRAVIVNPKGVLRPGQFVRVYQKGAVRPNAILVPQKAVMQGAKGHFVWIISKENKAEFRDVEVGDWYGDYWFINRGIRVGERVAVDGVMKLATGVPVKIVEVNGQERKSSVQGNENTPPVKSAGVTKPTRPAE